MITFEKISGKNIDISYGVHESPFGLCLIGISGSGICHLAFIDKKEEAKNLLEESWPKAHLTQDQNSTKEFIEKIFHDSKQDLHLLIKGSDFQIKVWEALLKIPQGKVSNYSQIAKSAGSAKAVRAAGTACGKNKIAYLIPCHRVLSSSGRIGGYRWGIDRKKAMLAAEA